ncbi:hypothetical protein VTK73DRAFT_6522 [Phialemonium thermophilum]|uniref:Protein kinase domain-containing protein n=1 Tax=Phialemonium thermophilum TaxID=223376 RepID=A0ABR3WJL9_9PEZI
MSTPTTATATLPRYNHPHRHPFPHHQQYQDVATPNYRTTTNPTSLSASSRLPYPNSGYFAPSGSGAAPYAITISSASSTRTGFDDPPAASTRVDSSYTTMPPSSSSQLHPAQETQPARKRRRSREPDWNSFYKNGLPKEVIVISDTPEPEQQPAPPAATSSSRTLNNTQVNGTSLQQQQHQQHAAKKRKRNEESAHYDPVYHTYMVGSHGNTPNGTPSKSTISTDRTSSAIHTTAATSLDSLSSTNGQYGYDAHASQKRKRTTRQQIASETARRRDAAIAEDANQNTYLPPPYPPKKASDVHVKVIPDHSYASAGRVDDDDGHYIVVPDADLTERYQMIRLLGQGTFGKVVQARDRRRGECVAIKIIRSVQKYRDASKIELRVLATLKANDEQNRNRCIHLRECFDYRGHICIVTDLLGQSVFDFLKSNNFVPFPNSQIQSFARQLFTSVAFLHDLNLIHTDLKPENILLCHNEYQTFTYNRKIPSSSTTVNRQATQRRVLLDTEIRLIDFGSATFQDEYHSSVVSTRHYRAPEIILGLGWSFPCDIWSIGCILVEFFTGDALFQTHDNLEHLAMMEAVVNSRIDTHLVSQVTRSTRSGGNPASKYFKRSRLDYPTMETTRASRKFVKAMKRLDDIIPANNRFLQLFLDLLKKIFVYDPARRITAKQALDHPWFKEIPHPDDGSEAAKIRLEKMRMQQQNHNSHRLPPMNP